MGLFDRFKKKPEASGPFHYRIDDVFKIKSHGTVVTGQVLVGRVRKGDAVSYGPAPGETAFSCAVGDIERPDPATRKPCHPEEARADGPYRGSCALLIPEHDAGEFQPGWYLFKE